MTKCIICATFLQKKKKDVMKEMDEEISGIQLKMQKKAFNMKSVGFLDSTPSNVGKCPTQIASMKCSGNCVSPSTAVGHEY